MFKAGDIVRCVCAGAFHGVASRISEITEGKLYKVVKLGNLRSLIIVNDNGEEKEFYSERFVRVGTFTKADLRDGMRVEYRDGTLRVIACGMTRTCDNYEGVKLGGYSDNMIRAGYESIDIMKVWAAPASCEDFFNLDVKGPLFWERVEKTEKELEYEKLLAQIEELKQQAEKLKP